VEFAGCKSVSLKNLYFDADEYMSCNLVDYTMIGIASPVNCKVVADEYP